MLPGYAGTHSEEVMAVTTRASHSGVLAQETADQADEHWAQVLAERVAAVDIVERLLLQHQLHAAGT